MTDQPSPYRASWTRTITVALTGASGSCYGLRLIDCLLAAEIRIHLLLSPAARVVLHTENNLIVPTDDEHCHQFWCHHFHVKPEQLQVHDLHHWIAPIASGSQAAEAMVICPCTMGTLASIASGLSDTLIERAADVTLKERRPLILVARETPLSLIHLENMMRVTRAGGIIMPACPGFYLQPRHIDDLIDFLVARILDHLHVPHQLVARWGDASEQSS
jgi:4-hydroxy-3-polyprenylbenzoate decarboxylase